MTFITQWFRTVKISILKKLGRLPACDCEHEHVIHFSHDGVDYKTCMHCQVTAEYQHKYGEEETYDNRS